MVQFIKVETREQIAETDRLARQIWNEHYSKIITQQQIDYMLAKFQSEQAITEQINNGVEYYLLKDNSEHSGYIAVNFSPEKSNAKLSKYYVKKSKRGKGLGRKAVEFIEQRCRKLGIEKLWLTVNKNNSNSISIYEKLGFENKGSVVQDIGQGFVMDDYKMEKQVT